MKKILSGVIILLVLIQFVRIDKTNPKIIPENDFINITNPSEDIAMVLKNSCYDCHSNESTYPWYTNIAPISWWIKHHINEGRRHINFSEWGDYPLDKLNHKLEECYEEIEEGKMPMTSYTIAHPDAKMTTEQKNKLKEWLTTQSNFKIDYHNKDDHNKD